MGVALVVAVLFVTLGWRSALIVAMVLPVVSLASVATLNALAVPIHQMSVTGLIVALGLLVDAAIVMTDEVGKRLRAGLTRLEAVAGSVRRLTMPLAASTITTILSFLPLLLLPGPAGDFVGSIAISVIVMLAWSFVVAVTITPAIAGRWLRMGDGQSAREGVLMRGFRALLALLDGQPAPQCGAVPGPAGDRLPVTADTHAAVLSRQSTATSSTSKWTCRPAPVSPRRCAWCTRSTRG